MGTRLAWLDSEAARDFTARGLTSYERLVNCEDADLVHRTGTTCTRRLATGPAGRPTQYYLKVYCYGPGMRRGAWRRDKATIEAANYEYLRRTVGVDVPGVVCHGSRRRFGRLVDALLVTRAVDEAIPMGQFFLENCSADRSSRTMRLRGRLLERSADLVSRMHSRGFFHIDLQWRNLLVAPRGAEDVRLYVIDSPRGGVRRTGLMRHHGRLRDLSSLWKEGASRLRRSEQLRWFLRYMGSHRLGVEHRDMIRVLARDRHSKGA